MKTKLLLATVLILTLGCKDFLNSSDSKTTAGDGGDKKTDGDRKGESFPEEFDPNSGPFSEYNMLSNIGLNVIYPKVKEFRVMSEVMGSKINNYCRALNQNQPSDLAEESAQLAWKEAMLAFHAVDSAPIGPQLHRGRVINDNLYAWPHMSPCGIDVEVERYGREGTPNNQIIISMKGLGALEYLLFSPRNQTECPARFVKVHEWLTKEDQVKKKQRCQLAAFMVEDVIAKAQSLEAAWDPSEGNFSKGMVDGTFYSSMKLAVNAMSDALFSIERVKDERLGVPLGLHSECSDASGKCVNKVEHRWSGIGLEAIRTRLQGFQHVLWGAATPDGVGYGFDDDLRAMGRADVSDELTLDSLNALRVLDETVAGGALQDQVADLAGGECDNAQSVVKVCVLHRAVREISNAMKTDFLAALSLRAPPTHRGDND